MGDPFESNWRRIRQSTLAHNRCPVRPVPVIQVKLPKLTNDAWRGFPEILAKQNWNYGLAQRAAESYRQVLRWKPHYEAITLIAMQLSMKLDERGKLVFVHTKPASLTKLINKALFDRLIGEAEGQLQGRAMSTMFEKKVRFEGEKKLFTVDRWKIFSTYLGHVMLLAEIYKDQDNKNLVERQNDTRAKEANKRKLRFATRSYASLKRGTAKGAAYERYVNRLWADYQEYRKRYLEWDRWRILEDRLSGKYKDYPQLWDRR